MIADADGKQPEGDLLPDQLTDFKCYDEACPHKHPDDNAVEHGGRMGKTDHERKYRSDEHVSDQANKKPLPGRFKFLFGEFGPLSAKEIRIEPDQASGHVNERGRENGPWVES